jgi:hypothetical protein
MLEPVSGAFSIDLPNAAVLALSPALPFLVLAYIRHSLAFRSVRPEFPLRKSELVELNRAIVLHHKVSSRIQQAREAAPRHPYLWRALIGDRADLPDDQAAEYEDLQVHAEFLQTVIIRLRTRPLQRLKTWIHKKSFHSALGWVLATDIIALLSILTLSVHHSAQTGSAIARLSGADFGTSWYPVDGHTLYANAVSAGLAIAAAPLFYLAHLVKLRRQHSLEFCLFKDLATIGRGMAFERLHFDDTQERLEGADEQQTVEDWRSVLQVSRSATVEEIRIAYRLLIKQCHPDRVHGMSEAFRRLAEVETKKLNFAYQQALVAMAGPPIAEV